MSFPIIDITESTLTGIKMYVDVLHNRADNFQDRMDIVARSGNNPADLGVYTRDSGVASFKNGMITGADTGIAVGGNFASGSFDSIDIVSPADQGIEVTGTTTASMDDIEVDGGNYGVLVSSSGSGNMDVTNIDFDGQNIAGVYYVKDLGGEISGSITNSAGAAYKYGPLTTKDKTFDSITLTGNNIGIETAGSGDFVIRDSTITSTTDNIVITGSAEIDYIEGTIDTSKVNVTGLGGFDRQRVLEVQLDADNNPVGDTNIVLMNADNKITGVGETDATGKATDLTFRTERVEKSGTTTDDLNGYRAVTVAEITYTTTVGDFRYAFQPMTLTDASGNTGSIDLTDRINARVCEESSSTQYSTIARCAGYLSYYSERTLSDGDGGTYTEYGVYYNTADMSGKTVMMDTGRIYMDDNIIHNWNNTLVLITGSYTQTDTQRWYAASGSNAAELYLHNAEVYGIGTTRTLDNKLVYNLVINTMQWTSPSRTQF